MSSSDSPQRSDRLPEVTVGLFGPRAAVRQMQQAAEDLVNQQGVNARFLASPHRDMSEAKEKFQRLADRIDAALFPGPMHYDLAEADGWKSVPSSHVQVRGGALYAALLRTTLKRGLSRDAVARVSVDSLSRSHVVEAFAELDLPTDDVHALAYTGPDSVAAFADFHRRLLDSGQVDLSLTTILSVHEQLTQQGYPTELVLPTGATVRSALRSAVMQARGIRLGDQQITFAAVQLLTGERTPMAPSYWQQSAAARLHSLLLDEAHTIGATVSRRSDTLFLITLTRGGLEALTDQLSRPPFMALVRRELGLPLAVGLGTGRTAMDAEANAVTAMESSLGAGADRAFLITNGARPQQLVLGDPTERTSPRSQWPAPDERDLQVLQRIIDVRGTDRPEVDVEEVASALQVTERSGRRILKGLVDAGLAWQLPGLPPVGGGRPRQRFRLLPGSLSGSEPAPALRDCNDPHTEQHSIEPKE